MQSAQLLQSLPSRPNRLTVTHLDDASPCRGAATAFIQRVFARHYGAHVSSIAPNLLLLEEASRVAAVAGWRGAGGETLFLERYLDTAIEQVLAALANRPVARERIVEVGNLAAEKPGGSLHVFLALAGHLDRLGYEWVVFTATRELIGMFARLGLPLLALAKADPSRLGDAAREWGSYYRTEPVVVAGRIRVGLERMGCRA